MKTTIAALAAAALCVPAAAQTAAEVARPMLTFEDAIARALRSSPAVLSARQEIEAAQGQRRAVLSSVLPHVTATGSLVRNTAEVTFGSGEDLRTILPRNDWNYRLTLSQPVFAGLRDRKAYSQAGVGIDLAREGMREAEDETLLRVAGDYLDAVQAQALIEVERKNLGLAAQRRVQAQNLMEAGEATRVDVLRAETAVKAAERRVVAAQQRLREAEGRLRVGLALDPAEFAVQEPVTMALPPLPEEGILLRQAEERRPNLRRAAASVRIAELEVSKQKGAYLPVITADAGYVRQKTTFPKDQYGFAALRFTVPLFQSGEVGARVATARARQRQAELALEDARRAVREDVHTSLHALQTARTNLALAQEQLDTAEAEYQQTFELYRSQEATSLDVESSEAALAEARRAAVTGRLELRLAELTVWAVAGQLRPALAKEVQ